MSGIRQAVQEAQTYLRVGVEDGRKTVRAGYCFPKSSLVVAGHFPENPILPAVVQILMVQMVLENENRGMIRDAKFMVPLTVAMPIDIVCTLTKNRWMCTILHGADIASRITIAC
ncbi:MAG: hypothetical protein IJS54_05680 [Desulfovibrio sp.]|nr:hypothetical protein [Desulfovibrio sp.]